MRSTPRQRTDVKASQALAPAGDTPPAAASALVASAESPEPGEASWGQVSNDLRARVLTVAPETDEQKPDWATAKRQATLSRAKDLTLLVELQNADDKGALFHTLEPCLIGSHEAQPYSALAAELGMTEGAVKMAVCRLRERYRACLKEKIAHTVTSPVEVDEELRHLFRVLNRG